MLAKTLLTVILATSVAADMLEVHFDYDNGDGRLVDIPQGPEYEPGWFYLGLDGVNKPAVREVGVMTPNWAGVCYFYAAPPKGADGPMLVATVEPGSGFVKVDLNFSQKRGFGVECD